MGLLRKDLQKEILIMIKELESSSLRIPDNWLWWDKRDVKLHEIEAIDLTILKDILKLHNAGKLNSELTSKIVNLSKQLREIIVKMMRQQNPPANLQSEESQRSHQIIELLDSLINSTVKMMPGGKMIGPGNWHLYYYLLRIMEDSFDLSERDFNRILVVNTPFTHSSFYSNLPHHVKNPEIFKLYVLNTVKFGETPFRNDVDLRYVLFYRRTQPSSTPKPEAYWTWNLNVAIRGMNTEHSEAYRKTAVILVADLKTLLSYQGKYEGDIKDDSIYFEEEKPFNQNNCLCIF